MEYWWETKTDGKNMNPSAMETPNTITRGGRPGPTEEADPLSQLEKESAEKSRKKRQIEKE